jgi:hypothetical protein
MAQPSTMEAIGFGSEKPEGVPPGTGKVRGDLQVIKPGKGERTPARNVVGQFGDGIGQHFGHGRG